MPKISLRKCKEHDSCQLERVDGGEWAHTPATRTVGQRFALQEDLQKQIDDGLLRVEELRHILRDIRRESREAGEEALRRLPDVDALGGALVDETARAAYLRRLLEQVKGEADAWLAERKAEAANLPKTLDLQHKANQARLFLDSQLKIAQEAGERLERAFQKADSEARKQAGKVQELQAIETRLLEAEARIREKATTIDDRLDKVDSLLANLYERKADLDRVDAVYDQVDQLNHDLNIAVAALQARDKETRRLMEHERKERLDATEKGVRSLQEHVKVSHV